MCKEEILTELDNVIAWCDFLKMGIRNDWGEVNKKVSINAAKTLIKKVMGKSIHPDTGIRK